ILQLDCLLVEQFSPGRAHNSKLLCYSRCYQLWFLVDTLPHLHISAESPGPRASWEHCYVETKKPKSRQTSRIQQGVPAVFPTLPCRRRGGYGCHHRNRRTKYHSLYQQGRGKNLRILHF